MRIMKAIEGLKIETRPYQVRICSKVVDMFAGDHTNKAGRRCDPAKSVMIESPTGSGKTCMGMSTIRYMQQNPQEFGANRISVIWTAMRRELLGQASGTNVNLGFNNNIDLLSMFANELPKHVLNREPGHKVLLAVDECQHDATDTMSMLHEKIKPDMILGLSATPYRTDSLKLCFEHVVKDAGIHQLIRDGYLSQYDHYTISDWAPSTVAEFYLREPERWGKSLFFFTTFDRCSEFAELVRRGGRKVEVVTANTDRESQLKAFEGGDVDGLVNMNILTEGFDCPSLKTAFVRPSGKGCTIQMAGRVFRLHSETPRKQVVQCQQTKHTMLKTATPEIQNVWQGGEWRSLKVNPRILEISRANSVLAAGVSIQLPEWLAGGKKKKVNRWTPDAE